MLNSEEKKYLSSSRLSLKLNYIEFTDVDKLDDLFYYFGEGLIISTINGETFIDKNFYKDSKLVELLKDIFTVIDTIELVIPYNFLNIYVISKAFEKLNCDVLKVEGNSVINCDQLNALNKYSNIHELKVYNFDRSIKLANFRFRITPLIDKKFTSEKFKNFLMNDVVKFDTWDIELPINDDIEKDGVVISEAADLNLIISNLVDIDVLSFTIMDDGEKSLIQSLDIIDKIEKSIGSKIENIYYVTGNRTIRNIETIRHLEEDHKLCIMYDTDIICSLDDFIFMRSFFDNIVSRINKFELSSLERCLYAYDFVKNFYIANYKYIKDKSASRFVHRLFKANNLNSQAYTELFAQLLRELKINAASYMVYSPLVSEIFLTKNNHERTMIYLNDKKYKINGLFSADVVWDAIKKIKKNYHYEFFMTRVKGLKKQFSKDKFGNEVEYLLGNLKFEDLNQEDLIFFEIFLNKSSVTEEDLDKLKGYLDNNMKFKDFLYSLSAVRVANGVDKSLIKTELVAVVNKVNKRAKFVDEFSHDDYSKYDINYLQEQYLQKKI